MRWPPTDLVVHDRGTAAAAARRGPGRPDPRRSAARRTRSRRYYAEILRNEGLNAFTRRDIIGVTAATLANYDVAILGDISISAAQATMFERLGHRRRQPDRDAPRPDLAGLLGLTDTGTDLSNAYLQIDTTAGKPGAGLVAQTIQFHGTADRYTPDGGTDRSRRCTRRLDGDVEPGRHASRASARTAARRRPSPTTSRGRSSTRARATRRGPATSATASRPSDHPIGRPVLRRQAGDVQPDWVDLNKVQIPQADEQQRLLVNLIEQMNLDKKPLPQFWYFPRGEKAVVVMTGDDHATGGTSGQFDWAKRGSPPNCNVADWDCVRGTSYIYPNTPITDAPAAAYEAQGFEIALHVNTNCGDWTPASLEALLRRPARAVRRDLPERRRRRDEPHPLHHLERLGDASQGRARPRHPARHELLLLARTPGSRTGPATSPAPACPCASPTSTDR